MYVKFPVKGNNINYMEIRAELAEKSRHVTCDVWCEIENIKRGIFAQFFNKPAKNVSGKSFIEFSLSDSARR